MTPIVYKTHPFDGTPAAGKPIRSRQYKIVRLEDDHPVDGPVQSNAVARIEPVKDEYSSHLSEYMWNLWIDPFGTIENHILQLFIKHWEDGFGLCPLFYAEAQRFFNIPPELVRPHNQMAL